MHQTKLVDIRNNFKWTPCNLNCYWEKPMCINSVLNGLQVKIELKWIKCMMDDENSKGKTLASN